MHRSGTVEDVSEYRPPRRIALIVLVVVAVVGFLALGYWQWNRFTAAGGDGQNLGYALQWPAFAFFCVYAYRKFVRLEAEESATESGAPAPAATAKAPTEIPEDLLPARPKAPVDAFADDPDELEAEQVREYNDYLAQLSRRSDRSGQ